MRQSYFDVLGIAQDATMADVKKAYRELANKFHPDKNPDAGTRDVFDSITRAYKVLSDPLKREEYQRGISLALTAKPRTYVKEFWNEIIRKNIKKEN